MRHSRRPFRVHPVELLPPSLSSLSLPILAFSSFPLLPLRRKSEVNADQIAEDQNTLFHRVMESLCETKGLYSISFTQVRDSKSDLPALLTICDSYVLRRRNLTATHWHFANVMVLSFSILLINYIHSIGI